DAGLHLVEDQQQSVLVADLAQRAQEARRRRAHAAFTLDRLDQDRGGLGADLAPHRPAIPGRPLVAAVGYRAEALERLLLPARRQGRERAAVEGTLERDDAVALGAAARRLILARDLDGALHRLGAGIAEEHRVREARRAQPFGQPLAFGNAIEIGDMPDLGG